MGLFSHVLAQFLLALICSCDSNYHHHPATSLLACRSCTVKSSVAVKPNLGNRPYYSACLVSVLQESHEFGDLTIMHASWSQASGRTRSAGLSLVSQSRLQLVVSHHFLGFSADSGPVVTWLCSQLRRRFTVLLSVTHAMTLISQLVQSLPRLRLLHPRKDVSSG